MIDQVTNALADAIKSNPKAAVFINEIAKPMAVVLGFLLSTFSGWFKRRGRIIFTPTNLDSWQFHYPGIEPHFLQLDPEKPEQCRSLYFTYEFRVANSYDDPKGVMLRQIYFLSELPRWYRKKPKGLKGYSLSWVRNEEPQRWDYLAPHSLELVTIRGFARPSATGEIEIVKQLSNFKYVQIRYLVGPNKKQNVVLKLKDKDCPNSYEAIQRYNKRLEDKRQEIADAKREMFMDALGRQIFVEPHQEEVPPAEQ